MKLKEFDVGGVKNHLNLPQFEFPQQWLLLVEWLTSCSALCSRYDSAPQSYFQFCSVDTHGIAVKSAPANKTLFIVRDKCKTVTRTHWTANKVNYDPKKWNIMDMLYLWNFICVENVIIVKVYGLNQIFCSKSKSKFYLKEVFINVLQAQKAFKRMICYLVSTRRWTKTVNRGWTST